MAESPAFISHLAWLVVDIPGTNACEAAEVLMVAVLDLAPMFWEFAAHDVKSRSANSWFNDLAH